MLRYFARKIFGVLQSLVRTHLKVAANSFLDDTLQRCNTIGGLPENSGGLVQGEQRRILSRHDHHLAIDGASRHSGAPGNVETTHAMNSQTRGSGTKVSLETGTCSTKCNAELNTACTNS